MTVNENIYLSEPSSHGEASANYACTTLNGRQKSTRPWFGVTCTSTKDTQVIATDCIYKLLGSSNIAQCILYTINNLASGSWSCLRPKSEFVCSIYKFYHIVQDLKFKIDYKIASLYRCCYLHISRENLGFK